MSMLRSSFLALVALALAAPAHAVNLVPNPSFETYSMCPPSFGNLYVLTPWDAPNTATPDAFNACAPNTFPSVSVPINQIGQQTPLTGSGYAGLIPISSGPQWREYLSAPLSAPLVAGQSYTVTFHVSLADSASEAVDRLGAHLSVGAVGPVPNSFALAVTPQVESPVNVFLTNSTGWTAITGTFVASGGENWITIGNFHDDASTNTVPGPGNWPGRSYYYVDDASVEVATPTLQACCSADGSCSMQYPGECTLLGGLPLGPGSTCTSGPCGPTPVRRSTWGALKTIYR